MYVHNSSVWFGEFRNSFDLSGHGPLHASALGLVMELWDRAWVVAGGGAGAHDFLWIVLS